MWIFAIYPWKSASALGFCCSNLFSTRKAYPGQDRHRCIFQGLVNASGLPCSSHSSCVCFRARTDADAFFGAWKTHLVWIHYIV